MFRLLTLILVFSALVGMEAYADGEPSVGAQGMPGAKGTFEFIPNDWIDEDTWWKDSDGIAPEIAGCHIGTDINGAPNGRAFGEACLENGLLVESNPGAYAIHKHIHDIGYPDRFDCNDWCIGAGASKGVCTEVVAAPPCEQSAMCACN